MGLTNYLNGIPSPVASPRPAEPISGSRVTVPSIRRYVGTLPIGVTSAPGQLITHASPNATSSVRPYRDCQLRVFRDFMRPLLALIWECLSFSLALVAWKYWKDTLELSRIIISIQFRFIHSRLVRVVRVSLGLTRLFPSEREHVSFRPRHCGYLS